MRKRNGNYEDACLTSMRVGAEVLGQASQSKKGYSEGKVNIPLLWKTLISVVRTVVETSLTFINIS